MTLNEKVGEFLRSRNRANTTEVAAIPESETKSVQPGLPHFA